MATPYELRCTVCGQVVGADLTEGTCRCGGVLSVDWDVERAARILTAGTLAARPATMLRYRELLPLAGVDPALGAIVTPLLEAPALAAATGVGSVAVKVEGMQPSGSLKDRASAIAAARAQALGHRELACASSGNAATAMAAQSAAQGLRATVFVPRRLPAQKLLQLHAYGARILVVDGPYEAAYALCQQAAPRFGWYNRNCAQNPYLVEGKKTCGLEIAEQTVGDPPDWVAVPVGDGCTIAAIWKGMRELNELGLAHALPRMLGVQASAAATTADAWRENVAVEAVESRYAAAATVADSIAVTHPHNGARAVEAIRDSGGAMVTVGDDAIAAATLELPSLTGVFAEPAAAATLAGVRAARAQGMIGAAERVVLVTTGIGFKNLDVIAAHAGAVPEPIPPTLQGLVDRIGEPV